jgi:hypothetical protein
VEQDNPQPSLVLQLTTAVVVVDRHTTQALQKAQVELAVVVMVPDAMEPLRMDRQILAVELEPDMTTAQMADLVLLLLDININRRVYGIPKNRIV